MLRASAHDPPDGTCNEMVAIVGFIIGCPVGIRAPLLTPFGLVAGEGSWQRFCAAAATLGMLAIGVMVQRQFWHALPVWHHWVFFLLILTAIPLGGGAGPMAARPQGENVSVLAAAPK